MQASSVKYISCVVIILFFCCRWPPLYEFQKITTYSIPKSCGFDFYIFRWFFFLNGSFICIGIRVQIRGEIIPKWNRCKYTNKSNISAAFSLGFVDLVWSRQEKKKSRWFFFLFFPSNKIQCEWSSDHKQQYFVNTMWMVSKQKANIRQQTHTLKICMWRENVQVENGYIVQWLLAVAAVAAAVARLPLLLPLFFVIRSNELSLATNLCIRSRYMIVFG